MSEKAGMQALIAKPCSQPELINALRAVLDTELYRQPKTTILPGRRVLLVDDSALNRDLFAMSLTDAGLQVAVAGNGVEGWNMLQKQEFDLLITDIQMPEMDGLELTRQLRASDKERLHHLPVIGLSGTVEEKAARAAGMDDFQLKTDSPSLLLASIGKLLASSPTEQQTDVTPRQMNPAASVTSYSMPDVDMKDLIRTFLDEFRDAPTAMRNALESRNIDNLREQAHKLKGSAALCGAEAVQQAAEALERSCRSGQMEGLDKQVENLAAALDKLSKQTI